MLLFCATQLLSNSEKAEERKIGLGIKSKKKKSTGQCKIFFRSSDSYAHDRFWKHATNQQRR